MPAPTTLHLDDAPLVVAPDGSDVRVLLRLAGGSMAHFSLAPGRVSRAVTHRTVSEIWFVLGGRGEMWRAAGDALAGDGGSIEILEPGVCLTIPPGTSFQFRASRDEPLAAIAITMPPWPGDDEAIPVEGYAAWAGEHL